MRKLLPSAVLILVALIPLAGCASASEPAVDSAELKASDLSFFFSNRWEDGQALALILEFTRRPADVEVTGVAINGATLTLQFSSGFGNAVLSTDDLEFFFGAHWASGPVALELLRDFVHRRQCADLVGVDVAKGGAALAFDFSPC
ncbi:MAG: hypothetical protein AAF604_04610 [Acidobacteriota bacterium]